MLRRARVGVLPAVTMFLLAVATTAAAPVPSPIGIGPRFHPGPTSAAVARMRQVGRLRCGARLGRPARAHVELFARRRVVIVPAGIGIAPPFVRAGAFVRSGRCSYPVRTLEPTGVVEFDPSLRPTLRQLFSVWGEPLSASRLAGFSGRVRAYVGGKRWRGRPSEIPLSRHAEIVLEVGGFVPPHRSFLFGSGR